jgi:hypothetical protein
MMLSYQVVYCEIDKVATHVFRHNHDTGYNSDKPDDDIKYVYYRRFETIERKLDQFMQEHAREFVAICIVCMFSAYFLMPPLHLSFSN